MVRVSYYTDPACPWSWALEPAVRKLMVEFGARLEWTFVMGGLARALGDERSRAETLEPALRGGLVAEWLRVAETSGAPLDPLMWVESPIRTTYPACMAVKAAAEQAPDRGYGYLRRLREGLMCERRRLDHAEALTQEARAAGLDVERFRLGLGSNAITEAFAGDLERTQALATGGAAAAAAVGSAVGTFSRGAGGAPLPTLVFAGEGGEQAAVTGYQEHRVLRDAALAAGAEPQAAGLLGVEEAVARFGRVTTREVEVLCELPGPRAGAELYRLAEQWRLRSRRVLTGHLWELADDR